MSKTIEGFLYEFKERLADYGDAFFSTGNDEDDYNLIASTIEFNGGYWVGVRQKYFYDKDLNFLRVEERTFGR